MTLCRILKKNFNLKPYKIQFTQQLAFNSIYLYSLIRLNNYIGVLDLLPEVTVKDSIHLTKGLWYVLKFNID